MSSLMRRTLVVALAVITMAGCGLGHHAPVSAAQQPPATWLSTVIWQPTLADAGIALAEFVNQIDASCSVDVDSVVATSGSGPEGPVYAFAVTWACLGSSAATISMTAQAAVVVRDTAFEPAELTIPADEETAVILSNEGVSPHNFSVDALGISVNLAPGETTSVTLEAPAGTYDFYCNVPGHRDLGMRGTITAE